MPPRKFPEELLHRIDLMVGGVSVSGVRADRMAILFQQQLLDNEMVARDKCLRLHISIQMLKLDLATCRYSLKLSWLLAIRLSTT
jgi:hypothetical protein